MKDIVLKENTGGSFAKPAAGLSKAVCVAIADLGPRKTTWQGVEQLKEIVALGFEVPAFDDKETGEQASGVIVWKQFNKTFNKNATLRKELESWRTVPFTQEELSGFKMSKLLGQPLQINIGLTAGGNPKIIGLLPKSEEAFTTVNKPFMYSYEDPDQDNADKLPKYMLNDDDQAVSSQPVRTVDENQEMKEAISALPF